ncbi:hypothetical protein ACFQH2_16665 [Natronoarchaeum sp. GCM10025703]|uniref:hypothetical protein n=1 Tax=Natronoarchaeum sp. GCM10025703 TaxID=3252685 RepID=UPI00360A3888
MLASALPASGSRSARTASPQANRRTETTNIRSRSRWTGRNRSTRAANGSTSRPSRTETTTRCKTIISTTATGELNGALVDVEDPLSSGLRTDNKYTDPGDPLIDFHGVKPGYGGEATLSYHLCNEPGKLKFKARDVHVDKKLAHLARARVWYDEFDGAKPPSNGNNGPMYPTVMGPVNDGTDGTDEIEEIIVTGDDSRFPEPGARNYDCDDYEDRLGRFEDGDLQGDELFGEDSARATRRRGSVARSRSTPGPPEPSRCPLMNPS